MPTLPAAYGPMIDEYMKATGQTAGTGSPTTITPSWWAEEPDDDISEKEFTKLVIELAQSFGWRAAHFRPAWSRSGKMITAVQGDGKGWLDVTLLRERLIVAELKCGKNKLTPEQKDWVEAWQRARIPAFVWYPHDWHEIVSILGGEPCPPQN